MNVKPTVDIIHSMSKRLREAADDLDRTAKSMTEKNDLTYASEAMQSVSNSIMNLRLDLLITRPLREFMRK